MKTRNSFEENAKTIKVEQIKITLNQMTMTLMMTVTVTVTVTVNDIHIIRDFIGKYGHFMYANHFQMQITYVRIYL